MNIVAFLKFCKIDHKDLLPQSERPPVVEEDPDPYTQKEMDQSFFVITDERDTLFWSSC